MSDTIKTKLNVNNYNSWYPLFEALIQAKGYKKHLDHETFDKWWNLTHQTSEREARYDRLHNAIKNKKKNDGSDFTEEEYDVFFQDLEEKYKDVLQTKIFKSQERLKWLEEEDKLRGVFTQNVESSLWPSFKEAKTTKEILAALRNETLHDKPGTYMSLFYQFFSAASNETDPQ